MYLYASSINGSNRFSDLGFRGLFVSTRIARFVLHCYFNYSLGMTIDNAEREPRPDRVGRLSIFGPVRSWRWILKINSCLNC